MAARTCGFFLFVMMLLTACTGSRPDYYLPGPERVDGPGGLAATVPVLFGTEVSGGDDPPLISFEPTKRAAPVPEVAHVRLTITGIDEEFEGRSFTLIGGGPDGLGFHGPESTGYEGKGYHFAQSDAGTAENIRRSETYKKDYTRTVKEGRLEFDIYYTPGDINSWGDRYFPGTDIALTLMHAETEERVLHAANNAFNWAIAGPGKGHSATIRIKLR